MAKDMAPALSFLEEALLLRSLSHPNCLRVVALVETPFPFTVLTEFCMNGNLKSYLRGCRPDLKAPKQKLTTAILCQTASNITLGMVFLVSKSIVHRELAAHSILVGPSLETIKISHFGRSRDIYMSDEYISMAVATDKMGSTMRNQTEFIRWMSPEAIRDQKFTYASDVWSAAVVFYELFSYGRVPHGNCKSGEIMRAVTQANFELPCPPACPTRVYTIMKECWHRNPTLRPTFSTLEAWLAIVQHEDAAQLFEVHDAAHTVPTAPDISMLQHVGAGSTAAGAITLESIAVRRRGFVRLKTIGEGQFGKVEVMAIPPGVLNPQQPAMQVAVKVLTGDAVDLKESFLNEARLMCRCAHPALVSVLVLGRIYVSRQGPLSDGWKVASHTC
jgi:abelson tyrosine-protein kinase 1